LVGVATIKLSVIPTQCAAALGKGRQPSERRIT
jgi:hypothetical protein